ncbi:MAG: bifunctional 5,10-methylenetetrahydrofolate dehydrogenase/5,10-methenyltetrahydrofolate cyclohydrolase [bacterium]
MATIIDGKNIAEQIKLELVQRIGLLKQRGIVPGLAAVLVGEDPASRVYVNAKARMCESLGMHSRVVQCDQDTSEAELLALIAQLNADDRIHGILVQAPLPAHVYAPRVYENILPEKDVDGFHPANRGRLQLGEETFVPCTPAGVQELLVRSGFSLPGKHVVIVGRSAIVGMPLALLLMQKNQHANATVTVCHSATKDLARITAGADILVAAIGRPEFVTGDMMRDGAVVIDVGVNRIPDVSSPKGYRLVGDVDFVAAGTRAAAITPVPGGVGPMTIIMLMQNTVVAAERNAHGA